MFMFLFFCEILFTFAHFLVISIFYSDQYMIIIQDRVTYRDLCHSCLQVLAPGHIEVKYSFPTVL